MNIFNKRGIDKVQDDIVSVINPTRKITNLEKKLKFSATFENQVALADAYLEIGMNDKAIDNYKESLKDVFQNDFYVQSRLLEAYYKSSQFDEVILSAQNIMDNKNFRKSTASFLYALALERKGNIALANELLSLFDAPYSNYEERYELAKFYIRNNKLQNSRDLIDEMLRESESMSKISYRQNVSVIKKIKELQKSQT